MQNKILAKIFKKSSDRKTTTKLRLDDDSIVNLKVLPLPVKDSDEKLTAVLNEKIARAY